MQLQEDLGGGIFRVLALPEEVPAYVQNVTIMSVVQGAEQLRAAQKRGAYEGFANS
jgi:hypothetical protein